MDSSVHVALSQTSALRRELDLTANNIANANTAGFKGERMAFESYILRGGNNDVEFVVDDGSFLDERQGSITYTGGKLDVALQGPGWFSYQTTDGRVAYGRDGQFSVDSLGKLVTQSGDRVLDDGGGQITFPPDTAHVAVISGDGTISAEGNGTIAKIGVFDLADLQSYERIGGGRFVAPEGRATVVALDDATKVVQGAIEGSNVQPIAEMTRLIDIQRAYERSTKIIEGEDELRQKMLQQIGRSV